MTARVLVVDDIAANLKLLEARLNAEYYEVALASSGPEALRLAQSWSPDVILLDVMMPGMDGYEVCERLKASNATAHMPVVMITGRLSTTGIPSRRKLPSGPVVVLTTAPPSSPLLHF